MNNLRFRKVTTIVYCALIVVLAGIIIVDVCDKSTVSSDYGLGYVYSIENDWVDANNEKFDFGDVSDSPRDEQGHVIAYYDISKELEEGDSICFMSAECYVKMYIDGQEAYETQKVSAPFYNKSPGVRWNLVRINQINSAKQIKLEIIPAYDNRSFVVDNVIMGDRARMVLEIIGERLPEIILSVVALLVGIVCMLFAIIMNLNSRKEKEGSERDFGMRYFAVFAMVASVWALLETNVVQLLSPDLPLVSVVAEGLLIVGTLPFMFFLDSCYGIMKYAFIRFLATVDLVYMVVAFVLHITQFSDFHLVINGALISYGVLLALMFWCIFFVNQKVTKGEFEIYYVFHQIGIGCMGLTMIIDIVRYLYGDYMYRGFFTRYGLVSMLLIIGVGDIHRAIKLVQTGMKSEIISHLAYSDGLTEVGNRTAYNERLENIESDNDGKVGIIAFDVNNLKKVNDNMGHAYGDDLICLCADLISDTFGQYGKVYRVGGDEFTVIIYDDDAKEIYDTVSKEFERQMKEINDSGEYDFPVVIASGFGFSESTRKEDLEDAIAYADKQMYENKKALKKILSSR